MATVNRTVMGVERTEPVWSWEGAPGPPPPMSDEELYRLNARIDLYGSDTVRENLTEFSKAQQRFDAAVGSLQDAKKHATGPPLVEAHQKVDSERQAVYDLRRKIQAQARSELHR